MIRNCYFFSRVPHFVIDELSQVCLCRSNTQFVGTHTSVDACKMAAG